ncbi:PREDICTED: pheophytinase, chloroplastic isoform X2 [Tarenaya hassleriana]|uniref:pheophytinase, chloroplastic isoform X2 n=1 Tax=Tarenaya hassleriana TaxID=28532 RepID=UPI00053C685D|nr:PREDICTED: pheophytinase, chloroplastic isoform X2 [Tarenaya hassleriana]
MEIISQNTPLQIHVVNPSCKSVKKSVDSRRCVLRTSMNVKVLCFNAGKRIGSREFSWCEPFRFSSSRKGFRSSKSLDGTGRSNLVVRNGTTDGYVIGGDEDVGTITRRRESASKVLIPGLPDESNGETGAPISSCYWEWRPKLSVHYEKAGCENVNSPAVLLLPGFGVGSFHYEKQLKDLGRDHRVWAVDFLGQGLSLPSEDPTHVPDEKGALEKKEAFWGFGDKAEEWASQLVYSLDLWRDQVRYFVEEVIGEPVYIAGNSLGGYVALYFAASYPDLVKGVTLLNATPFWGFLPNPERFPLLARLFPWSGTFPLPSRVKKLTELVWQKISDPESIAEILKQVYADHSMDVDKVFSRIVEITRHPAAAASLASIMCAPSGQLSFTEALSRCKKNNVPICLVYGREDPWVRPIWGFKIKKQISEAPYYEISPAGHCPHDEVPEVLCCVGLRAGREPSASRVDRALGIRWFDVATAFGLRRRRRYRIWH